MLQLPLQGESFGVSQAANPKPYIKNFKTLKLKTLSPEPWKLWIQNLKTRRRRSFSLNHVWQQGIFNVAVPCLAPPRTGLHIL